MIARGSVVGKDHGPDSPPVDLDDDRRGRLPGDVLPFPLGEGIAAREVAVELLALLEPLLRVHLEDLLEELRIIDSDKGDGHGRVLVAARRDDDLDEEAPPRGRPRAPEALREHGEEERADERTQPPRQTRQAQHHIG
jgi:hypothetical protein